MGWYRTLVWPVLVRRDPEQAHDGALRGLRLVQGWRFGRYLLHTLRGPLPSDPVTCCGLTFPNRLGMAAGFDKDVQVAPALAALGFGHVEVGTLTPRPQGGNPRPRIFRLPEDGALINRMGFPNGGVVAALPRLRTLAAQRRDWVLGVSLGKQKETPLEEASADYIAVMQQVWPYADYLAVNVSSPNTPGLRALQGGAYLGQMLAELAGERGRLSAENPHNPPLLVKIAPDLTDPELDAILQAAHDHAVDGLIATNTTLGRDGLRSPRREEAGGLSGEPLRLRSRELVGKIARRSNLPVIGVGGIATPDDCRAMLDAGATLVQLYTAFVYAGPGLPGRLLRGI